MAVPRANFMPFVSVVIPCYNGRETICDCMHSLVAQSYPVDRYEIIVADNGSTDGTCELIRSHYPAVRLIHCSEKGSGYARNSGIVEARGELILSTDSDCVADKDWIASLTNAFTAAALDVAAIGGCIVPFSLRTTVEHHKPAWPSQPDLGRMPVGVRFAATPNAGFRTSLLKEVGAFDGALGFDDTDLGIRLLKSGYKIEYTALAVVRHRNPATIRELYKHRLKYGIFGFTLSRKHPELLGDPMASGTRRALLLVTLRRIAGDILKLPLALFASSPERPRIWPLLDATMALANYTGYSEAKALALKSAKILAGKDT